MKIEEAIEADSFETKTSKKNIIKFFKVAKNTKEASDWPKQKLGAVITYKNKILSIGWNCKKETAMQKAFNKYRCFDPETSKNSSHAEINALIKLIGCYNIDELNPSKLSIFIYREHQNGELALAKPCSACEHALRKIGIQNIFYTGNNSIIFEKYLKED